ncbi:hypothetical protein B0H13DRAFT_2057884, partial [Mycena leptocephala]
MSTSATATATASALSMLNLVLAVSFLNLLNLHRVACDSSALRPILPAFIYVKICGFLAFPFTAWRANLD